MAKKEVILRGLPIAKGIGIGFPVFFSPIEEASSIAVSKKEVEREIHRYRHALELSRKDIEKLQNMSFEEAPPEVGAILGTHLEMMNDPMMTTAIETRIRESGQNIESIFLHLIEDYKKRFNTLQDVYFQERIRDIVDVSRRILGHLNPLGPIRMAEMPHNSVILTHELVPSETVEANATSISAFVTAAGGITSHAAIIARAKGIPYVANIDMKLLKQETICSVIVDGSQGLVILNPSKKTLKKYQQLKRGLVENYKKLKSAMHLRGETIDGYEVRIFANLENPSEIDLLRKSGAAGVGLFRSEYLLFAKKQFPTEEEQYEIYKTMAKSLKGNPLVVRIFDIGGDKKIHLPPELPESRYFSEIGSEMNPALGCRAIRFLLHFPELLEAQLRAILRASTFGEIHILIPMISDLSEVHQVKQLLKKTAEHLQREGYKIAKEIPLGCMIEVPSSAIMSDALAQETDFLSIGTNDLIQYVLAADRSNPHTSELYYAPHPSILHLIRKVVLAAHRFRKPVLLCGECAADPTMIPILLGLGIREFSVAARHIPLVKHTIRKWRILEASRLAEGALEYTSALELKRYLAESAK